MSYIPECHKMCHWLYPTLVHKVIRVMWHAPWSSNLRSTPRRTALYARCYGPIWKVGCSGTVRLVAVVNWSFRTFLTFKFHTAQPSLLEDRSRFFGLFSGIGILARWRTAQVPPLWPDGSPHRKRSISRMWRKKKVTNGLWLWVMNQAVSALL